MLLTLYASFSQQQENCKGSGRSPTKAGHKDFRESDFPAGNKRPVEILEVEKEPPAGSSGSTLRLATYLTQSCGLLASGLALRHLPSCVVTLRLHQLLVNRYDICLGGGDIFHSGRSP